MLWFFFPYALFDKIYSLKLYHLLNFTLHSKANACNIGTFIRFYMQMWVESKANACNICTFIRFYMQMLVEKKKLLSIEFLDTSHNSADIKFEPVRLGSNTLVKFLKSIIWSIKY